MPRPFLGALLLLALAPGVAAQKPPVFESALELVNVTVTVRDDKGRLVGDLTASDFVVFEDGRPQTLASSISASSQALPLFAPVLQPGEQEALSLNLGLLFDTSESMKKQLRLSQESAIRFLDSIPRARDLILVFFDHDIRLSRYSSENQQGIFGRILETQGSGNTALYDAIAVYLSRVADTSGRKVLVVFTDGDDTTSSIDAGEVIRLVRSVPVTIYPVFFQGPPQFGLAGQSVIRGRAFLYEIARSSGGQVFNPQASRDLAAIYEKILDELGHQYVLGYVSDNPRRDGAYRRLKVEVKRPGLRVRGRPGYHAPGSEAEAKKAERR